MNTDKHGWIGISLAVVLVASGGWVQAHAHGEQWAIANEYPATSMPGEGDVLFAKLVADGTRGGLSIVPMPDAKLGYKSREQLKAVAEGKVAMADSFSGALGEEEPIFSLASLPFVVTDLAQARALYDAARPAYERAFARHNQKLLYATPWPPSGLWSRKRVNTLADLAGLRVRTYDKAGTDLFNRIGASAGVVSFSDLPGKLKAGEIDAVLTSGDGGAGRKLWDHLGFFEEINYAVPLSFTTVNLDKWKSLDAGTRKAVEAAALQTDARQWQSLDARIFMNYKNMRANDMSIHVYADRDPDMNAKLREAARFAVDEWAATVGDEGRQILARFRR